MSSHMFNTAGEVGRGLGCEQRYPPRRPGWPTPLCLQSLLGSLADFLRYWRVHYHLFLNEPFRVTKIESNEPLVKDYVQSRDVL